MLPADNRAAIHETSAITIGSPRYHRANVALFCAGFVTFITLYDIQPLLPLFAQEFGVSPATGSLPLSLSTATLAVAMLLAGTISESVGRKPLMSAAILLSALLALLTACTHSFHSLLAVRFAQGMILAGVPSVVMAYLGEEMDGSAGGFFWLRWGWHGIALIITVLLLLASVAAEMLTRRELRPRLVTDQHG